MSKRYCILMLSLVCGLATQASSQQKPRHEAYLEFNYGQNTGGDEWTESIEVLSPALRSEIQGPTPVVFKAPGMTVAKAMCWQQPTAEDPNPWGHDAKVAAMVR